ncbi:hypothetical protein [Halogeometricum luteum]|uniref:Uncharacterized protein n=1 Tax=Halogeometricum luteum TaxID=2950537 RepID=A0ABU2FZX6_9EURY|nr:hypothetical protein [Halogeometricum sp. S3BR5-2]MDS0293578.1 hypothetical protein [Halogeometricum sp. S3BR5-2]
MLTLAVQLQVGVPGGAGALLALILYGLFALVPVGALLAAAYFLYQIRADTNRIADSLERLEERV